MCKNPAMAKTAPAVHRVAVLALDGVVGFDLGTPPQVFGAARDDAGRPLYEVRVCTVGAAPARSASGYAVTPEHGLEALAWADTVIVAGVEGRRAAGPFPPEALEALRDTAGRTRTVSICTGAFVLASAGLLDGRPATTHWLWADLFRELHPDVLLDPQVLFVDDGDVLTSAGVAAGVDLCLHLVRRDHGAAVANRAARRCVVPPWRSGGQSQFIERQIPAVTETSTATARAWALEHLAEPLDLAALAARARMSVRTFTRRFRDETGLSPQKWLLQQRVAHARLLLESTDLSVDLVARRSGLGSATALRQHLQATIGVPPSAYRRTFRQT